MTNPLERARRDLESWETAIQKAEETLAHARRQKSEVEVFIRMYEHYSQERSAELTVDKVSDRSIGDAAEQALRAVGPKKLKHLHEALTGRGVVIPGTNPRARLSQVLSRDRRFRPLDGRAGWWLHGLPLPTDIGASRDDDRGSHEASGPEPSSPEHDKIEAPDDTSIQHTPSEASNGAGAWTAPATS